MSDHRNIGIYRRIDLEWLDAVAGQVAAGKDEEAIRGAAFKLLEGVVKGGNKRGTACHKTMSVLSRIWVNVSMDAQSLRDRAAHLLPNLTKEVRLGLHWALLTTAYPFFADVATNTGRLLVLQGNLTLAQLTRRMQEEWGDRSTITRATQRLVRSLVQWGILIDSQQPGIYLVPKVRITIPAGVGELMLEALLMGHEGKSLPMEQALRHPSFFPFDFQLHANQLRRSPRFVVHRQGLDMDVLMLVPSTRENATGN